MPRIKLPQHSLSGVLVAAAVLCGQAARADVTLWYNGDFDGRDALANQTGSPDGKVYDDFVVPTGYTFTITGVFSNNMMYDPTAASTASWEIRSGVSAGNGGTLVASGADATDTVTATGRSIAIIPGILNVYEYTNLVSLTSPITLTPGTYWLAVAPDVSGQNSYISTTSGTNAIGNPGGNDGNSFITSTAFGQYFVPTSDPSVEGLGTWDYSMGIIGTSSPIVTIPEPSSLLVGLAGLFATTGCAWARRRTRA